MPYVSSDNLSLFYREQGAGRLVLILPGNTASSVCHEGELDFYGQDYHAVSLDFRGTGKSQRLSAWRHRFGTVPSSWAMTAITLSCGPAPMIFGLSPASF